MKSISLRLKKAIIIGTTAVMMLSLIPDGLKPQSWFITGLFNVEDRYDEDEITIIKDSEEDIQFSFGIVELFRRIFS